MSEVTKILDELAQEYGDETFVSSSFAYYEDAEIKFNQLLQSQLASSLERASKLEAFIKKQCMCGVNLAAYDEPISNCYYCKALGPSNE